MYRAVTLLALRKNISHQDVERLCNLIDSLQMRFDGDHLIVNGEDLSDELTLPLISSNVSNYAAVPELREKVVDMQRKLSVHFDIIMDGRDIGTVVLKDAAFKFFLTAQPEQRAKRRYAELIEKGLDVKYEDILNEILKRDYIDSHREANPLKKAEDAIEIDSSDLSIPEVVEKIASYIKQGVKEALME